METQANKTSIVNLKRQTPPSQTNGWVNFLLRAQQRGQVAVIVTVASTKGSAPRAAGTKMVVAAHDVQGTIGGGHLEFKAIDIARNLIAAPDARTLQRFPLGAALGQCCGGVVNLLFEPVAPDATWVVALSERLSRHEPCVVVTTVTGGAHTGKWMLDGNGVVAIPPFEKGGSAKHSTTELSPRIEGDELAGVLDANVHATALSLLQNEASTLLKTFTNGAGQPAETMLFERFCPPDFHIVLFGAGHVGRALVKIMADWDCLITWVDSREDAFPSDTPAHVQCVCTDMPETCVDRASPGSYCLVMTHSHALDQALCEAILKRADFAYFGLIGSLTKRRQFESRLLARGFSSEHLAKMRCPIGIPGITGKEPATIAVAVAAELLQQRSLLQSAGISTLQTTPITTSRTA